MGKGSSDGRLIIWEQPDGSISVTTLVQGITLEDVRPKMEAQGFTLLKADATPSDLPNERVGQSRRFRNQWRWDGAKIEPDVNLCREQVMAEVRAERNARLDAADKERARLEDVGNQSQRNAHATYRQSLRNLPATVQSDVDALTTAADLEAHSVTWPTEPS